MITDDKTLKRMCLLILLLNGAVMVTEPSTAGAMSSTEPTKIFVIIFDMILIIKNTGVDVDDVKEVTPLLLTHLLIYLHCVSSW